MTRAGSQVTVVGAGLVMIIATLAGCANAVARPASPPTGPPTTSPPTTAGSKLVGVATVLDSGTGPQLCLGAVAESYPPQCGGPPIEGWTWPSSGTTRASGVTWGAFHVVGTYDGQRFTFEKIITAEQAARFLPQQAEPDFSTPCSEPAGGWRVNDPNRIAETDQQNLFAAAEKLPGYADAWIDDRGHAGQDPRTTVLNVQVTGSVEAADRQLRAVWGGPLCVSKAAHPRSELVRILDRLSGLPQFLSGAPERGGVVAISVIHDDGALQSQLDRQYGAGVVRVDSALRPYTG